MICVQIGFIVLVSVPAECFPLCPVSASSQIAAKKRREAEEEERKRRLPPPPPPIGLADFPLPGPPPPHWGGGYGRAW